MSVYGDPLHPTGEGGGVHSIFGGKMLIQKYKQMERVNAPEGGVPLNSSRESQWEQSRDDSAEPALFFKTDGTVFWVNPASLTFFKVNAGELLGEHYSEIMCRFGLRFSDCPYEQIGKSKSQGSRMVEYNGTWYTYRLEPVLGAKGDLRGFVSRILDTRDEICLQEAKEQLQHLMNATDNTVDMRLVRHMVDTAVKINGPLSHMRSNLEETITALQEDLFTTEELVIFLTVLMKSVGLIEGNLSEMNRIAIDGIDDVPDADRKYLSQ